MRKDEIDNVIKWLDDLWRKYPTMRLGQLLENFVFTAGTRGDDTSIRLFYQNDHVTAENIKLVLDRK